MNWTDQCAAAAAQLCKGDKQQILDLLWAGKSIGEIQQALNLSLETVCGVINENIENVNFLRKTPK